MYHSHTTAAYNGCDHYYQRFLAERSSDRSEALEYAADKFVTNVFRDRNLTISDVSFDRLVDLMVQCYEDARNQGSRRETAFSKMEEVAEYEALCRVKERDQRAGMYPAYSVQNWYSTYTAAPQQSRHSSQHGYSVYEASPRKRPHREAFQEEEGDEWQNFHARRKAHDKEREQATASNEHNYAEQPRHRERRASEASYRTEERKPWASSRSHGARSTQASTPLPHASNQSTSVNLYSALGVTRAATAEEIKEAYRKLSMKYHPDRVAEADKQYATEVQTAINSAYDVLSDERKRDFYDRKGRIPERDDGF